MKWILDANLEFNLFNLLHLFFCQKVQKTTFGYNTTIVNRHLDSLQNKNKSLHIKPKWSVSWICWLKLESCSKEAQCMLMAPFLIPLKSIRQRTTFLYSMCCHYPVKSLVWQGGSSHHELITLRRSSEVTLTFWTSPVLNQSNWFFWGGGT